MGTTWSKGLLSGSPLEYMARPAIVLKADDFGDASSESAAQFVETVVDLNAIPSIGIITDELPGEDDVLDTHRALADAGIELWFHGHRHIYLGPGETSAEFIGVGVEAQSHTFRTGLDVGRRKLGMDFYTFGAPGNDVDEETAAVMSRFHEFKVWLFGREGHGHLVLPGLMDIEEDVSRIPQPSGAIAKLETLTSEKVIALQIHPKKWDSESDLVHFVGF